MRTGKDIMGWGKRIYKDKNETYFMAVFAQNVILFSFRTQKVLKLGVPVKVHDASRSQN